MGRKKNRTADIVKYILSAAVACCLLYFSFKGVKWTDFMAGLRSCNWGFIAISMSAGILAFWLRAIRWRDMLLPIDSSLSRLSVFNAVNIGNISNFVFPRIGEFVRCGVITKNSAPENPDEASLVEEGPTHFSKRKASYDKVLGTVVLERSWDMLTMILLFVLLLSFKWNDFGDFFVEKMWKPFENVLHFNFWWLVLLGIVILAGVIVWRMILLRERSTFANKVYSILKGLVQGLGSCFRMKHKWKFFVYTVLIWSMYWIMSVATMWALPDLSGLGIIDGLFLMIAGSFGWLVPVPGGFGAFHFIVSLALSTIYGIPFELGIIFATLSHESQAITMALSGGISYVYEALKK